MKTRVDQPLGREVLSALMDGELRGEECAALLASASDEARECWQLYHLVGDVLRSADLAACGQDPGLATRVVARIQQESPITDPDQWRPQPGELTNDGEGVEDAGSQ